MTLFEYLAIAFGLVFAQTALRLVGGLPSAFDRARSYWVHLCFVVTILVSTATAFWTFWSHSEVAWTLPGFFLALGIPGIMYFNAATLVPVDPGQVASWRDYYYESRVRLFGGITAWALLAAVDTTVNVGLPIDHPARIVQATTAVLGLIGLGSASPRIHGGLAVSIAAIALLTMTIV